MKKFFLILLSLPLFVRAQQNSIMVEGTGANIYVNHKAAPKENFYSIGRLYNISPKDIAPFNKLTLENGLSIGQTIKVPLKSVNFTQANNVAVDEIAVPVYHLVEANETLFQVSNKYGKVTAAFLKKWNNLNSDDINQGQNLIIGYLKVKKDLSAFAQVGTKMPKEDIAKVPVKEKVAKTKEVIVVQENNNPQVKQEIIVVQKVEPIVEKMAVKNIATEKATVIKNDKEGFFKAGFNSTGKGEEGMAGIFKSTSGWEDGKFYCLHNLAEQNSIIKITNPANGKFIYAKVLDVMPDLKQNNELSVRISSAAADALGADSNSSFSCKISY
jgi:LysM repeat protein